MSDTLKPPDFIPEETPTTPDLKIPRGSMQVTPLSATCNICGETLILPTKAYGCEEEMVDDLINTLDRHNEICPKAPR